MKNAHIITKVKGRSEKFLTVEHGKITWTNKREQAIRFADKQSAQMLIDADFIIPGKVKGLAEPLTIE